MIEVLVVVMLIGIVAGFVTLSYQGGKQDRELEEFAKQIKALCKYSLDHAVFNSEELGLIINKEDSKLQFVRLNEKQQWENVTKDNVFRDRDIPSYIELDLNIEGESLALTDPNAQDHNDVKEPQILFLSSGELIPFELRITVQGLENNFRLKGLFSGKLQLFKNDDQI